MGLIFNFVNNIYSNRRRLITFIFLSSVFFSLIFLIFLKNIGPAEHKIPGTDYFVRYEPIANNILEGKGIILDGKVQPEFAPGFSVILAGIFALSKITGINKLDLVVVLNIILTALSSCFLFLIAKEIFNKKIALLASILWMTYPFNLWFIKNPNTEAPFMLFLYLGIFLFILSLKRKNLKLIFLAGFILGLSSLIRLPALFLPFFLALTIFFLLKNIPKKRQFLFAAILLMGNFAAIFPWGIYSFYNTGSFIPVSNLAVQSLYGGFILLLGFDEKGGKIPLSQETRDRLESLKMVQDSGAESNDMSFLIEDLKNNPWIFLKLIGLRIIRVWYGTGRMWWENSVLAVQSFYLLGAFGGILYGIRKHKDKIRDIILLLLIIFYFWGITFLTYSILRYMIPAMGLVIIFSAVILDLLIGKSNLYGKFGFNNNSLPK